MEVYTLPMQLVNLDGMSVIRHRARNVRSPAGLIIRYVFRFYLMHVVSLTTLFDAYVFLHRVPVKVLSNRRSSWRVSLN